MRQLYLPWSRLTLEERATALREARRRGARGTRAEQVQCQMDAGDSIPIARPVLYVSHLHLFAPVFCKQQWRRLTAAERCADLRVCHYGDSWERTRRALVEEPVLPREEAVLTRRVREAREAWAAAQREREAAVRRSAGLPSGHLARLAAARALMRLERTEDEYWLAVMLAGVAAWKADCLEWTG